MKALLQRAARSFGLAAVCAVLSVACGASRPPPVRCPVVRPIRAAACTGSGTCTYQDGYACFQQCRCESENGGAAAWRCDRTCGAGGVRQQ